ncbi:MAG: hypothetical protein AAF502_17785 [Bacteroidota bacterium]
MSSLSTKNSFDSPEKGASLIWLGAFFAGLGFLIANFLLPYLNSIFGLDFTIGFATILIAFFIFAIADRKTRNRFELAGQSFMRTLNRKAIKSNPLKALDKYLKKMRKDIREIAAQLGTLRGQMRRLSQQIEANKASLDILYQDASKAKENRKKNKVIIAARKISRLEGSIEKLEKLFKKMEVLDKILFRIYTHTEILHEDVRDQIEVKKIEFKAMTASAKAMRSAKAMIGKNQKRQLFDQAVETLAEDVALKVGEIENYLNRSTDLMDTIDFQSGQFEKEGLKMLEDLEKESATMLLNVPEKQTIDLEKSNEDVLDLNLEEKIKEQEKLHNPYDDLFE